jgi:hypothetical protein
MEKGDAAFHSPDGAVNQRYPFADSTSIQGMARSKIVHAINDDLGIPHDSIHTIIRDFMRDWLDPYL